MRPRERQRHAAHKGRVRIADASRSLQRAALRKRGARRQDDALLSGPKPQHVAQIMSRSLAISNDRATDSNLGLSGAAGRRCSPVHSDSLRRTGGAGLPERAAAVTVDAISRDPILSLTVTSLTAQQEPSANSSEDRLAVMEEFALTSGLVHLLWIFLDICCVQPSRSYPCLLLSLSIGQGLLPCFCTLSSVTRHGLQLRTTLGSSSFAGIITLGAISRRQADLPHLLIGVTSSWPLHKRLILSSVSNSGVSVGTKSVGSRPLVVVRHKGVMCAAGMSVGVDGAEGEAAVSSPRDEHAEAGGRKPARRVTVKLLTGGRFYLGLN
ncbi:hypothetical protein EYF80_001824 [Liparis tanakae]|uniref:Uncharacterized protein n=1 Tax=Liparis tanakae TaxID=230148 RepID=A0A4Z2JCG8_9TELE|nr:hypothetical protein EYF80_001824 [Liparis tanakae]